MGGQACILYGAAEFSRDTDFAVLASSANLTRLRRADARHWAPLKAELADLRLARVLGEAGIHRQTR